MPRLQKRRI